jgi:MarR family transcriptional regulator for hemolysin
MKPTEPPIGLLLAHTAKAVGRAFEETLAEAGGSTPTWLVLLSLMPAGHRTQTELAKAVGIQGPTLTHHLNGLEKQGLIERKRLPDNRRAHRVEVTEEGRALFHRLRRAALDFDACLRKDFAREELSNLRDLLGRMTAAVSESEASGRD